MKTISYDGVAAPTTDAVADAVLDLAIAVARYNRYEQVTLPVLVAGNVEWLTLMLGPTIHISSLTIPNLDTADLDDSIEDAGRAAAAQIRQRVRSITEPLHALENVPDSWGSLQH